ncbi:MAG TPA: ABC transporter permease [Blastocatellia bacterium]|nr:ABC transporter permease [Blastocatellia bacterium]
MAQGDRFSRPYYWLINFLGLTVPRRLRADWRQEWEAELHRRESVLAEWDKLTARTRAALFLRSLGAFTDALLLQPKRLEDEMLQDIRYGARMLWNKPGFSAVVVLTLALGIGANAALFSVVNGVLLNPLPYREPDQLVTLHQSKPNFQTGAIPYPNFRDWQERNQTFSAIALSRATGFTLVGAGEAERVSARWVTARFFSVLDVAPVLGRTFQDGEDEQGAAPVAIISEGLWRRKFGAAPDILDKSLTLDDKNYTIIGVIPASFSLHRQDVFVPMGQWGTPALKSRAAALGLHGIGRLKAGVTVEQGRADLARIMQDLAEKYPSTNRNNSAAVIPLKERMIGDIRPVLLMLLGAVGFVLLIACVNVSNLLLARSTGRTREFAIRSAIGAGRWRLLRQSLTESLLLSLLGGGLGLALAAWGTKAALAALPTALPRAEEVGVDPKVLFFTVSISLLTGILSGLAPALKTSHRRLAEALKEGARGASSGRVRAQGMFVAVEMALALVLLVGAGLMLRSLHALWNVDAGFRPDHVLTFDLSISPALRNATPAAIRSTLREVIDKISSTPGVTAASLSAGASPLISEDDLFFWIDGQPKPASQSEMHMSLIYRIEPDYLSAMGIPLKRGRFFTDADDERSQPVAVIDEAFAHQYFGSDDPVGQAIRFGESTPPSLIVGVVGHVHQWSIDADDKESLQAQLYVPFRALPDSEMDAPLTVGVLARDDGSSGRSVAGLLESIRESVQSQSSQNVISAPLTMNEAISTSLAERRFAMILLGSFAGAALLLASLGIYGVISYLVGQLSHELGIRLALGAQRRDILRLVMGHGMKMAVAGVVIGLVGSFGLTRLIIGMLYGVRATDPMTFTFITVLLIGIAAMACYIPARRATRVDPLAALRQE